MPHTTTNAPLRWGILGPGNIARRFANDVKPLVGHSLRAVGSRDRAKADAFADSYDIVARYGSYEDLLADPNVDVVYVATPHTYHREHTLLALRAGKHVLCEKPFTINATEAEDVVAEARRRGLFLMEGMWTRCFPAMIRLRELASSGAIGDVRMLNADFGFRAGIDPNGRLFNRALGGGALMDVGIYPVSLASMLFGAPNRVTAMANIGSTGVDEETAMLLGYNEGRLALLSTAVRLSTVHDAVLYGTEGSIRVQAPWWTPRALVISRGGKSETEEFPFLGGGFQFEAEHVATRIREGEQESDLIPLDETLQIMRTLDRLRSEFGLVYPMES